eukprot:TRINITY_DN82723_c0_g1_i1.p1 TRINITY_DN82723_c0_g1~~TRINITY_DN82723_c0_g1_i1.p1  ORF type:complete len:270 (+),score=29.50 TRINITY_DN82723_c0_g1_i1:202-1011(+)
MAAVEIQVSAEATARFSGKTVLITGCSRGLGLGLAKVFGACGALVIATCRNPDGAAELKNVAACDAYGGRIHVLECDLASEDSIERTGKAVEEMISAGLLDGIDVLINNAGISTPNHPIDPILAVSAADMNSVMQTNVIGTTLVTQRMLPLMRCKDCGAKMVVNISSQLASIQGCWGVQGHKGGVSSYRISRAAANMATRCFAAELSDEGFTVLAMSPGHVATDMGSSGGRTAPLSIETSCRGILETVTKTSEDDSGRFLQYDGQELPW